MSAYKLQMAGNYPEESIHYIVHFGEAFEREKCFAYLATWMACFQ
jgi:hypothetical protein